MEITTIDRYKFLGAICSLKERFSVADIAQFSGLNVDTVRALFKSEDKYIEPHSGAKFFKLKPSLEGNLRAELEKIYSEFPRCTDENSFAKDPTSLRAAEEASRNFAEATTHAERNRCIILISLLIDSARGDTEALSLTNAGPVQMAQFNERIENLESAVRSYVQSKGVSSALPNPDPA